MLTAINANTGNEHDIKESFVGFDDAVYRKMASFMIQKAGLTDIRQVITLPSDEKFKWMVELQAYSRAHYRQVSKFLHYPIRLVRSFGLDSELLNDNPFP